MSNLASPLSVGRRIAPDQTRWRGYRVGLLGATFVLLLVVDLVACWGAVTVVGSTRAYAVSEGHFSRAQKVAVLSLYRFVHSRQSDDYAAFEKALTVPQGYREARLAMQTDPFDRSAAIAGLMRGGNSAHESSKIIRRFRTLRRWQPFATAVADWTEADRLVAGLQQIGMDIAAHPAADAVAEERQLSQVRQVDDQLSVVEDRFLTSTDAAVHTAKLVVVIALILITTLLWSIGMLLATMLFRRQLALDRKLRISERRFRDYAEVASDWYWEVDADRKITFLSELYYTLTGAAPESVIGQDATEFLRSHAADPESWAQLIPFAAQQTVRGMRLRYCRADGSTIYLAVSAKPNFDEKGQFAGYRGVGSDITAAVESAQNLRSEKERAEIANRAKSEFLANMSHELRTPLNAIIGFSEIMMNRVFGPDAPQKYDAYAADINNSGRHLLAVINEILDLSKIEAGREEIRETEFALSGIVESVRSLFKARFEQAGLALAVDLPVPSPTVRADAGKLKQCLSNLLSNALKFTSAGGTVTVSSRFEAAGGLAISVRDTGIGIAARNISTVLSPFGQVESAFQRTHAGTGLGLPITKALVELHGGTLRVESEFGVGTDVILTLPYARIVGQPLSEAAVS